MKPKHLHFPTFIALGLITPASADVIYSNLQDISIPANFDGLYLDVDGPNGWNTDMKAPVADWDINPFYGGGVLANSPAFQPVRSDTGNSSAIVNLAGGASVGTGSVFSSFVQQAGGENPGAPGYGFSPMLTTSGGSFTAGEEGYLGFRLNGANYGWMRVVFTDNTGGALIKDWAYDDNSGAAIATGNVQQSGSTVTLDSSSGSFTLGSQITGGNSVVKNGFNSATLTGNHSYSGTTSVAQGQLLVNGSISGNGDVNVDSGATLGGSGSVIGGVNVSGVLAPGSSIESFGSGALNFNPGSTYAYELQTVGLNGDLTFSSGGLNIADGATLTLTDLSTSTALANGSKLTLISSAGIWNGGLFTYNTTPLADDSMIALGANIWSFNYNDSSGGSNFTSDQIGANSFVTLTVIPEPSVAALLGAFGTCLLLRRRRR